MINGSILQQVKQFNYVGCELNIDEELDLEKKTDFKGYVAL
jgi:hypothetical protein